MRIIAPLLKLGIGGSAVYFIVDQGLFSANQKETIEASKRITDSIPPVPELDPYLEKIPKSLTKQEMMNYWNSGVKISIATLAALPENSKKAIHKGFNYLKDEISKQVQNTKK